MTREEEMIQEAIQRFGDAAIGKFAFCKGAQWADEHPKNPWVSIEERLPETKKCANSIERSDLVLIRRKGDRYPMRAWYWNDGKFTTPDVDETPKNSISEIDKSDVKAWMPILSVEGGEA